MTEKGPKKPASIDVIDTKVSFILEFQGKLEKRLEAIDAKLENMATKDWVNEEITKTAKALRAEVDGKYGLTKRLVYGAVTMILVAFMGFLVSLGIKP